MLRLHLEPKHKFHHSVVSVIAVGLLAILSCGQVGPLTPRSSPSVTPKSLANPSPIPDISALWYLTRGGSKLDQGWEVDLDAQGNIYFGTFPQVQPSLFADMVGYTTDSN